MKKFVSIGALALATLFAVLGLAPSASAYPDATCPVTVNHQVVHSGQSFTATGITSSAVDWVMTFDGATRSGTGTTFVQTFTAPSVSSQTVLPLVGQTSAPCQHTVGITVLPANAVAVSPPSGSTLPNTGGPYLIALIAGLALAVGGGVIVKKSRKHRPTGGARRA